MRNPSKRDDGKRITIVGIEGSLDAGTKATGVYRHIPRGMSFWFDQEGQRPALLSRDAWLVVPAEAVWKKCNGEAHSNFHIDHCMVCLPWWTMYPTCPKCGRKLTVNFTCRPCHARYPKTDQPKEA